MKCLDCNRLGQKLATAAASGPEQTREQRIQAVRDELRKHRRESHNQDNVYCERGMRHEHSVAHARMLCFHYVATDNQTKDRDDAFAALSAALQEQLDHHSQCGCPDSAPDWVIEAERTAR